MKVYHEEWARGYPGNGQDFRESELFVYWECRISQGRIQEGKLQHGIFVVGEADRKEQFWENFTTQAIEERLSSALRDIGDRPGRTIESRDQTDRVYQPLVEGISRLELKNGGVGRTVAGTFEDLQPVFEIVTECIPKR